MLSRTIRSVLAVLAFTSIGLAPCFAHGGTYRGPGDTTPRQPATGGGSSSGGGSTGGGLGAASGPSALQPGASAGGAGTFGGAGGAGLPGGLDDEGGRAAWEVWWQLQRESYLPPRRAPGVLADDLSGLERDATSRDVVLPALVEIVGATRSNAVRAAGLIAIARLGSLSRSRSELRELLEPALVASNQEVAETAAVALGLLGDPAALDLLLETFLGDTAALRKRGLETSSVSERTRAFAVYGLALLGERTSHVERSRIVSALVRWIDEEAPRAAQAEVSVACVVSLSLLPLPADRRLAGATLEELAGRPEKVDSRDAQIRRLVHALGDRALPYPARVQLPTAIARLAAGMPRGHALRALAIRECSARLHESADEGRELQAGCVLALGRLGDAGAGAESERARRTLLETIGHRPDPAIATLAWISLGLASSRPGEGAEPWAALLDERGPRRALSEALRNGRSGDRPAAALGLALLERGAGEEGGPADPRSLALLRDRFAEARTPDVQAAVAIALGLAGESAAAPSLRAELGRASDPSLAGHLSTALGMLRDGAGTKAIEDLVRRSRFQSSLVEPASRALAMLGAARAEDVLLQLLSEAGSGAARAVTLVGLSNAGAKRSVPALLAEARRDKLPEAVRAIAVAALGRIADPRERPWIQAFAESANWLGAAPTLRSPPTGDGLLDLM
jgi:hypothetical protein